MIGFLDRSDALHRPAAAKLGDFLAAGIPLVVSVISYAEVMTGAKRGRHDEKLVRGFFTELVSEVLAVDVATAERAAELRSAHKRLRMPDALILAGAELHEPVDRLVCGDRGVARLKGLRVTVDPLTEGS